jgi:hypothetical protein
MISARCSYRHAYTFLAALYRCCGEIRGIVSVATLLISVPDTHAKTFLICPTNAASALSDMRWPLYSSDGSSARNLLHTCATSLAPSSGASDRNATLGTDEPLLGRGDGMADTRGQIKSNGSRASGTPVSLGDRLQVSALAVNRLDCSRGDAFPGATARKLEGKYESSNVRPGSEVPRGRWLRMAHLGDDGWRFGMLVLWPPLSLPSQLLLIWFVLPAALLLPPPLQREMCNQCLAYSFRVLIISLSLEL